MLIDTHCHIHSVDYKLNAGEVVKSASSSGVEKLIVVGVDAADSKAALDFADTRENVWASVGLHPHDAKLGSKTYNQLKNLLNHKPYISRVAPLKRKVVAIGECGLDYFYNHSDKKDQEAALHFQLSLAKEHDLPMIFHVRGAFDDFWTIFDQYSNVKGVVHSFTAGQEELTEVLSRDLFVGLNGITTFTKDLEQLAAIKAVPLDSLVLETDAPFLTPTPYRGKINEPKQILQIAKFLSSLRDESLKDLATATTQNAEKLFNI